MTREELVEEIERGLRPKYLLFWGHQPERDGGVGKGCLSQWWEARFEVEGISYPSAEHYMMAEKASLFADRAARDRILAAQSPGAAKAIGREVAGFDAELWQAHRFEIVVAGNVAKFGQTRALRAFLLGTGTRVLVEASPRDRIWGIGLAANDADAADPSRWQGENLLGFALMEARARLGAAPA